VTLPLTQPFTQPDPSQAGEGTARLPSAQPVVFHGLCHRHIVHMMMPALALTCGISCRHWGQKMVWMLKLVFLAGSRRGVLEGLGPLTDLKPTTSAARPCGATC
jgi:hypothetical protein